jgi:hydrogenase nickel incorporation protein HypA/HybF
MHEYALVQDLLEQVTAQARAHGATGVKRITVGMGELAGVDPDLFTTAFETFRAAAHVARDAELSVHWVDARWVCGRCEQPLERGAVLRCPGCGVPGRLAAGDELILERVELEVPDPQALRGGGTGPALDAERGQRQPVKGPGSCCGIGLAPPGPITRGPPR